jgi:hypothetical protein
MVCSWKNIFEIPPCGKSFFLTALIGRFLPKTPNSVTKIAWRDFKNIFC